MLIDCTIKLLKPYLMLAAKNHHIGTRKYEVLLLPITCLKKDLLLNKYYLYKQYLS